MEENLTVCFVDFINLIFCVINYNLILYCLHFTTFPDDILISSAYWGFLPGGKAWPGRGQGVTVTAHSYVVRR
jgi:hypothetical protein